MNKKLKITMDDARKKYRQRILSNRGLLLNPNITTWDRMFFKDIIKKFEKNETIELSDNQKMRVDSILEVGKALDRYESKQLKKLKAIRDSREKKSRGIYRYALNKDSKIVYIEDLVNNIDRQDVFSCPSCKNELIPRFKKKAPVYTNHFYHKHAVICNNETYLHVMAIKLFEKQYTHCITTGQPFKLITTRQIKCDVYPEFLLECTAEEPVENCLTKIVPEITIENSFNGIIPDVCLHNFNDTRVLLIEIAVTHPCDQEKLEKGFPIIEFSIKTEEDLEYLKRPYIKEVVSKIQFFNFKKLEARLKKECVEPCPHEIFVFGIHKSGKCILLKEEPFVVTKPGYANKFMYCEILGPTYRFDEAVDILFRKKVQEYHFFRNNIKNCFTCKSHGGDGDVRAVFCFFSKNSVQSNDAVTCNNYHSINSFSSCQSLNKRNDKFKEKVKFRKFTNKMMGGRLNY